MPPSLNDCLIFLYLTRRFLFRLVAITFQITARATYVTALDFFTPSFPTFKDPETGVMLRLLAYLVSCANLYLYSATMCTIRPLLLDYLPIRDSTDLAVISILSSYFLFRITILTFLIRLSLLTLALTYLLGVTSLVPCTRESVLTLCLRFLLLRLLYYTAHLSAHY
jgi:hypothetical protein